MTFFSSSVRFFWLLFILGGAFAVSASEVLDQLSAQEVISTCGIEDSNVRVAPTQVEHPYYRDVDSWVPTLANIDRTVTKTVRLSFHIMQDVNGAGNTFSDDEESRVRIRQIIDWVNVSCNVSTKLGNAIQFLGASNGAVFYNNIMSDSHVGLLFNWSNIGQQGSSLAPTGNRWEGDFSSAHIRSYNSLGANNVIYVNNNAVAPTNFTQQPSSTEHTPVVEFSEVLAKPCVNGIGNY